MLMSYEDKSVIKLLFNEKVLEAGRFAKNICKNNGH